MKKPAITGFYLNQVLKGWNVNSTVFPASRNGILTRLLTSAGQAENTSGMLKPELVPCAQMVWFVNLPSLHSEANMEAVTDLLQS